MENFIYETHSGIRWLVVLLTLIAFVWLLVNMLQAQPYTRRTHQIMVAWSSLIGVQWLIGIVLLLILGQYTRYQWEHTFAMTAALLGAHLYIPFKKRPDLLRYQAGLAVIASVSVIVLLGVQLLPQGWTG
ncbi:MAG: hypothetical protein ACOCYT_03580 [Chloroflexota bacterium]